jgi:secondary thiamine-phosphate synthase enzyme
MHQFNVQTTSRTDFINVDSLVNQYIQEHDFINGILTLFIPHTTAGITLNENADPDVTADMEKILDRMVPWENNYAHAEGNSAAHVKASMMGSSATLLVENKRMQQGTWQSVYLCEFDGPRTRQIWMKGTPS